MLRTLLGVVCRRSAVNTVKTSVKNTISDPQTKGTQRSITTSSIACLKEIVQVTEGDVTKVEGKMIESKRTPHVLKLSSDVGCTLCKIHPYLKYTDVLILSQFLREDGCLLPRRVTGVCKSQQIRLAGLVNKAQRAGLMPQYRPALKSGKVRTSHHSSYKWKRYNVHF